MYPHDQAHRNTTPGDKIWKLSSLAIRAKTLPKQRPMIRSRQARLQRVRQQQILPRADGLASRMERSEHGPARPNPHIGPERVTPQPRVFGPDWWPSRGLTLANPTRRENDGPDELLPSVSMHAHAVLTHFLSRSGYAPENPSLRWEQHRRPPCSACIRRTFAQGEPCAIGLSVEWPKVGSRGACGSYRCACGFVGEPASTSP
jgi:hypothetical protein